MKLVPPEEQEKQNEAKPVTQSDTLQKFLESLSPEQQAKLKQQMEHSVSHYKLNGAHWLNPHEKEDLLQVLLRQERYVVDSNSNWKAEAKKPENRDKAFIIGRTLTDEEDNLRGVLFGPKTDITNNNIFNFGLQELGGEPLVLIERLDLPYRLTFDETGLAEESQPRAARKDAEFLARQQENREALRIEREQILRLLGIQSLNALPPEKVENKQTEQLLAFIRQEAASCVANYPKAVQVARCCYALLLLQVRKMRTEFNDPNYLNVFGDTVLIQNALFLQANVLSGDAAVHTMMGYIGNPNMRACATV